MKNLTKYLLLIVIAIFPVIILLSSIFAVKASAQTECQDKGGICRKDGDQCLVGEAQNVTLKCGISFSQSRCCIPNSPTPTPAPTLDDCGGEHQFCCGGLNGSCNSGLSCNIDGVCRIPVSTSTPIPAPRLVWRLLTSCSAPTKTPTPTQAPTPTSTPTPAATDCTDSGGECKLFCSSRNTINSTQCHSRFPSRLCCIPNPPTPTSIPAQDPSCTISISPTSGAPNETRFEVEGKLFNFLPNQGLSRIEIANEENTVMGSISPPTLNKNAFSISLFGPFTKLGNYHLNVVVSSVRTGETVLCRSGNILIAQRPTPTPTPNPPCENVGGSYFCTTSSCSTFGDRCFKSTIYTCSEVSKNCCFSTCVVPTQAPTPTAIIPTPTSTPTSTPKPPATAPTTPPTPTTPKPAPLTPTQPAVAVTTPSVSCPLKSRGDANCDSKINIVDFNIWRDEFKKTLTTLTADFDGKDGINIVDFNIWRDGFKDPSLPH